MRVRVIGCRDWDESKIEQAGQTRCSLSVCVVIASALRALRIWWHRERARQQRDRIPAKIHTLKAVKRERGRHIDIF